MSEETCEAEVTCPVCRAEQPWTNTCRRCRCDLGMLRQADAFARAIRRRALVALHNRRWTEALDEARAYHAIYAGEESRRLLAVCCLRCGNFREAQGLAR